MVKFVALYKKPADIAAFEEHYHNIHIPLCERIPGLTQFKLSKFTGSPMGESEYYMMAELYFDNMEALQAGMSSPEGRASGKDAMSFAKELVTMMFAEVEEKVLAKAAV